MQQPTQPGLHHRLARVNPTAAFLGALVVVLAGLFLPGAVGGAVLAVLALTLGWLTASTWSVQAPRTRVMRLLMLAVLVGVAIIKIM
jgi:putative effector of murein hydrolase LrgA (UPF0299 family)